LAAAVGLFDFTFTRAFGSRSRYIRTKPMRTVTPVAMAIIGKPSIRGLPRASRVPSDPAFAGSPEATSTTVGTLMASTSGGCTIGPNSPRRWTAQIAAIAPAQ
jgi:hypothetical protein